MVVGWLVGISMTETLFTAMQMVTNDYPINCFRSSFGIDFSFLNANGTGTTIVITIFHPLFWNIFVLVINTNFIILSSTCQQT